jgi:ribonuclease T2
MRIAQSWWGALAALSVVAGAAQTSGSHHRNQHPNSQPGVFDFYVLSLSWSPEFCYSHRQSPECQGRHLGFVVHGLWPQFVDGYPENCSSAPGPSNPASMTDIMPDAGLVEHEWATHGTCSGLDADSYFKLVRQAFGTIKIPSSLVAPQKAFSMTPAQVEQEFVKTNPQLGSRNLAVSCGNNYLTGVSVCLTKTLEPADCSSVQSCRANSIRIPPVH